MSTLNPPLAFVPRLPSLARAITQQRNAYDHQDHRQHGNDVQQHGQSRRHRNKPRNVVAARPANSTVLESLTSLWSIQRLSCRCRRATPRCAKCPRGRATRTRTNVGSATGVPSRTGCLNVPVRTGNSRFRPCNDRACRSAPGGRYVQPLERRVEPEVCVPPACATTAEKWRATSPAFSARTRSPAR
jgi:hypothetical protein